ncbi:MAG TPA: tetratricopeptide repeat protein [Thermoanaerobaculia bacterium]
MPRLRFSFLVLFVALSAPAQFVPPVPKTVTGGRELHKTFEIPLPSPKQQWVRARSPHFLALSGAGERRTREVVAELESVASALQQIDPQHFTAEAEPARLILFGRGREAAPYFDLLLGHRTPGAFVRSPEGSGTMLIDASWTASSDRSVFHELVHDLLANSGTRLPLWLEEGVAEYFSTAQVRGRSVRVGEAMSSQFLLRQGPLMHLPDLFAVDSSMEIASTSFFYSESWAVVDWMMRTNRAAFYAFLADVDRGASSLDALRRHFNIEPAIIERVIESRNLPPSAIQTVRLPDDAKEPEIEPLSRSDVIIELAKFLGSFEATRNDATRFLQTVIAEEPQNASAMAALAELSARERHYDEAARLYETALKVAPNDAQVRLSFAESLLGNAIGPFTGTVEVDASDAPKFRRARQLATEALAAGGDAARAYAIIGTSYLFDDDVTPGVDALRRAREMRPSRYDIALNLYALLLRSGKSDEAQKLYDEISSRARTPQAIFAARSAYVREQLALANRLIAKGNYDDAIVIIKHVADLTPDPNAKADLQRQLMKLRETGDTNRQITTYNQAVAAANAGQTEKAIEILDHLLETATDSGVISDATTLRAQLQKRSKGMRRSPRAL